MGNNLFFKVLLFCITLIALCIYNTSSQQMVKILGLNEGQMCRKALRPDQQYVCTNTRHCRTFDESLRTRNYLDICNFVGLQPIVCCPVTAFEQSRRLKRASKNAEISISADEKIITHHSRVQTLVAEGA